MRAKNGRVQVRTLFCVYTDVPSFQYYEYELDLEVRQYFF